MMRMKFTFNKNLMRKNKKMFFFALAIQAAIVICCIAHSAQAETVTHIIINEIQITGANSNDEFIELFNPTDTSITLDGYKLSKKTKSGTESTLLSSTSSTKFLGTIPAHGYFLIAHLSYKDKITADLGYSSSYSIASDNTILLYDRDSKLLDKVGFGIATDSENTPAINPGNNHSLERNNFADTNNNSIDFFVTTSPSPRNSAYLEPANEPNPAPNSEPDINPEEQRCATTSTNIKLNEVFPYPENGDEFVEITNIGNNCVDVSNWKVMDEAGHKKTFPESSMIYPGEYLYLEGNLYLNNDSDTAYLLDANGNSRDEALDQIFYEKTQKYFSFGLDGQSWQWSSTATPGKENIVTIPDSAEDDSAETETESSTTENFSLTENIFLNEILPNPKSGSDGEYIEIANSGSEPVDLRGWKIKDASKSKGYQFKEYSILNPGEYLTMYQLDSKISLNNSNETVYLYDPHNELASSATFEKSSKNSSYSFDGKEWKWTKYLTPGKKNKFDSAPTVKITKPKNILKNIIAEFSAKARDKETKRLKYFWDFGDGKKSYLTKTKHKYLDTGKYTVTLSVSDDSQTVKNSFAINVKKTPRPDIEITKIVPNPAGNDSDGEIIEVKNNSMKKIDLTGWKIATGSGKKIYNHPVSSEFIFNSNEAKNITREFSKFSLNNKAGKVQLVMPDEKVIDEVEYAKEKISEDEAYVKINGEWQWIMSNDDVETDPASIQDKTEFVEDPTDEIEAAESIVEEDNENANGEILGATDENVNPFQNYNTYTSYSPENAYIFLIRVGFGQSLPEPNYCPMKNPSLNIVYLLASLI
jgi:hypothetical protein